MSDPCVISDSLKTREAVVMLLPIAYKTSVYGFALLLPLLVWVIFQLIVSMRELEYTDDCKLIDKCTP